MRIFVIALVLSITITTVTSSVWARDLSNLKLEVSRVYRKIPDINPPGHPAAIVNVTNNSAQWFRSISVECAFLDEGTAIAVGLGTISNLAPGQTGTDNLWASEAIRFDSARCRISRAGH